MALLNPRALRWKIAALTAAACCAVAAVIGFLVHDATRERGLRVGHERTITRLIAAERELSRTGKAPPDVDVRTREELPDPLARDLADQPETGGGYATWYDADPPNWFWMWGAVAVGGDQFLVVRDDMSTEVRSLQLLDRSIVKSVLAALVFVVPLAALATEPINRRLRHGARTARRIADGELDARIGSTGRARDEITEMSAAVDDMATALQRKLENEQRFTADVAHELRTPLMGLVTAAGLLPETDEATGLVRDRVRALNALIEDLLEISRLDAGAERARLDAVPLGSSSPTWCGARGPGPRSPPGTPRWWRPTRAGWSGSWSTSSPTPTGTAPAPSRSPSPAPGSPYATTAPASPPRCSNRARSASVRAPASAAAGTGSG